MKNGKTKEKEQRFECYEFALQSVIKRFVRAMKIDISKVYINYVPCEKYGWIKGKFRVVYPIENS